MRKDNIDDGTSIPSSPHVAAQLRDPSPRGIVLGLVAKWSSKSETQVAISPIPSRICEDRKRPWLSDGRPTSQPDHSPTCERLFKKTENASGEEVSDRGSKNMQNLKITIPKVSSSTEKCATPPNDSNTFESDMSTPSGLPETARANEWKHTTVSPEPPSVIRAPRLSNESPKHPGSSTRLSRAREMESCPMRVSAFRYAIEPFLREHSAQNLDFSFLQTTVSESSMELPSGLLLPYPRETTLGGKAYYRPSSPQGDRPSIPHTIGTIRKQLKKLRVRTLLMRCFIIGRIARELEHRPWERGMMGYFRYSGNSKVERMLDLARELHIADAEAQSYFEKGRACGIWGSWDGAVSASVNSIRLFRLAEKAKKRELSKQESAEVASLLKSFQQRRIDTDDRKQRKSVKEASCSALNGIDWLFQEIFQWTRSLPWDLELERIVKEWTQLEGPMLFEDSEKGCQSDAPNHRWKLTLEEIRYIEVGTTCSFRKGHP